MDLSPRSISMLEAGESAGKQGIEKLLLVSGVNNTWQRILFFLGCINNANGLNFAHQEGEPQKNGLKLDIWTNLRYSSYLPPCLERLLARKELRLVAMQEKVELQNKRLREVEARLAWLEAIPGLSILERLGSYLLKFGQRNWAKKAEEWTEGWFAVIFGGGNIDFGGDDQILRMWDASLISTSMVAECGTQWSIWSGASTGGIKAAYHISSPPELVRFPQPTCFQVRRELCLSWTRCPGRNTRLGDYSITLNGVHWGRLP